MKAAKAGPLLIIIIVLLVLAGAYVARENSVEEVITSDNIGKDMAQEKTNFNLYSPEFEDGGLIPVKYTCQGQNINPPLMISNVPKNTESLVLIVEDPDIPDEVKENMGIDVFDHWIVYDIPVDTVEIKENAEFKNEGLNSADEIGYTGPCPPKKYEPTKHRYVFRLFAVDKVLDLGGAVNKDTVLNEIEGHLIKEVSLTGLYEQS